MQNGHDIPELSRRAPTIPDMPDDASAIDLARGYASVAAFILHQWPALIATLDRIEARQVTGKPQPYAWVTVALAVAVVVLSLWIVAHR